MFYMFQQIIIDYFIDLIIGEKSVFFIYYIDSYNYWQYGKYFVLYIKNVKLVQFVVKKQRVYVV